MLKRICKKLSVCVSDEKDSLVKTYYDVNFNNMYEIMEKVRLLEYTFKVCYKRNIESFLVTIIKE